MIIRKRSESGYRAVPRQAFEDDRLSFDSRGVLGYILVKPDDWEVHTRDLAKHSGPKRLGREALRRVFRELKDAGYLRYERTRGEGNKITGGGWIVTDTPSVGARKPSVPPGGDPQDGLPVVWESGDVDPHDGLSGVWETHTVGNPSGWNTHTSGEPSDGLATPRTKDSIKTKEEQRLTKNHDSVAVPATALGVVAGEEGRAEHWAGGSEEFGDLADALVRWLGKRGRSLHPGTAKAIKSATAQLLADGVTAGEVAANYGKRWFREHWAGRDTEKQLVDRYPRNARQIVDWIAWCRQNPPPAHLAMIDAALAESASGAAEFTRGPRMTAPLPDPLAELWTNTCSRLGLSSRSVFARWLAQSRLVAITDEGMAVIEVPSADAQAGLESRILPNLVWPDGALVTGAEIVVRAETVNRNGAGR